jgi:hypothetical protein
MQPNASWEKYVALRIDWLVPKLARPDRDSSGFILVVALMAVLGLSLVAVDLGRRSSASAEAAAVDSGLIEAGFAAEAGMARALAALSDDTDPYLARSLVSDDGLAWSFERAALRLRIRSESGKVDLMAGEIELVRGVVEALVPDGASRAEIMRRVRAMRNVNMPPPTISAILPPALRITALAARLADGLTVFSGQSGVDPLSANPLVRRLLVARRADLAAAMAESVASGRVASDLAAGLGSRLVAQRPLYTVEAEARLPGGIVSHEAVLVELVPGQVPDILRRLDAAPGDAPAATAPAPP